MQRYFPSQFNLVCLTIIQKNNRPSNVTSPKDSDNSFTAVLYILLGTIFYCLAPYHTRFVRINRTLPLGILQKHT